MNGEAGSRDDPLDLDLGQLDITSENIKLAGLEDELDHLANKDALNAVLDGASDPKDLSRRYETLLHEAEGKAIEGYIAQSHTLAALHHEVKECDSVLASIEELLGRFQSDLGSISSEIRTLQEQSHTMGIQLRNRKSVQLDLTSFIDKVAVPPSLIRGIMEADPAGQEFESSMDLLNRKLQFMATDAAFRRSAAFRDVAKELERLRIKAVSRCRDLLMERIYSLKKVPVDMTLKRETLMPYTNAAHFLKTHGGDIYTEVRFAYIDKVSNRLLDLFKTYWTGLERLQEHLVTAADLLGAPDHAMSAMLAVPTMGSMLSFIQRATATAGPLQGIIGSGGSGTTPGPASSTTAAAGGGGGGGIGGGNVAMSSSAGSSGISGGLSSMGGSSSRAEVFARRERAGVLAQLDAQPLALKPAENEGLKFPFEVLFRSLSKLLIDTASAEWLFCMEFWSREGSTMYRETMAPVLEYIETSLSAVVHEMLDPLSLLLAIRINRLNSLGMARRANPALDNHFDRVNLMLWPRLKAVLDAQLASVKSLPVPTAADGTQQAKLHPLTERYAQLAAALYLLHSALTDAPLHSTLERLQYAVLDKLLMISRMAFVAQKGKGTVFLIINFHHLAAVLRDADLKGLPASVVSVLEGEVVDAAGAYASPIKPPASPREGPMGSPKKLQYNSSFAPQGSHATQTSASTTAAAAGGGGIEGSLGSNSGGLGPEGDALISQIEESLSTATALYVDERLTAAFPKLTTFVKRGEAAAAKVSEGGLVPGYGPAEAAPLAKEFSGQWESVVAGISTSVARDFGSTAAGRAVQQAAFTHLLLHWSRFLELCKRQGREGAAAVAEAVTIPAIMYALKQHRLG